MQSGCQSEEDYGTKPNVAERCQRPVNKEEGYGGNLGFPLFVLRPEGSPDGNPLFVHRIIEGGSGRDTFYNADDGE